MNLIYDDNSSYSQKKGEDEMYQKTSPNDSNSMILEDNSDINKDTIYDGEFQNCDNNNFYFYNYGNRKPRNIIDYLNVNSDEYKKNRMSQKIKLMLINLPQLSKYYIDEICNLCWYYSKKLSHKKLSTILPVIVYKIITKYNIKYISLKDLKNKINFKYKTYFQNEKLFSELNESINNNNKKFSSNIFTYNIKTQKYSDLVYNNIITYIKKIKEKSQTQNNIIKIRHKKSPAKKVKEKNTNNKNKYSNDKNNKIIQKIYDKLSSEEKEIKEQYSTPFNFELNNCQEQCKVFIYNNKHLSNNNESNDNTSINNTISLKEEDESEESKSENSENKFNTYFKNKICGDILGLGMIKYFTDKNEIILLSYKFLKDIFNCNICQVKKSIIFIKLYINCINNI